MTRTQVRGGRRTPPGRNTAAVVVMGLIIVAGAGAWSQFPAQEPAPVKPGAPSVMPAAAAAVTAAGVAAAVPAENAMSAFGKMVPAGFVSRNVRVPSLGADGRLASVMEAATVTRLDDDRLATEGVHMEIHGKVPEDLLRVDLKSAVYHLGEQILRSGERSRITRRDFITEGDMMVFDARTSIVSMRGRVRTYIYDTRAGAAKSGGEAGAPAPAPERK